MIRLILFLGLLCCQFILLSQRLTLTTEELSEYKCQIVESYFEYVKHVEVVTNKSYEPRVRNANEIALDRLLHRNFTTSDFKGGNRESFLKTLKSRINSNLLLEKNYTVFDCPNFNFIKQITNDEDVEMELEGMDIIDLNIQTTKYKGWMLFAEEEYESYDISDSWANPSGTGITKNAEVKKLHYEIYPLDSFSVVLKIWRIQKIKKSESFIQKDSTSAGYVQLRKVKPEEFEPCCTQPKPKHSDSDQFNDLVDCAPTDPTIYPGAPEIIGDGIDQDCDGEDQLGEDKDKDGFYYSACTSPDPEIRKLCDCYEDDPDVHYRDSTVLEKDWYYASNSWNDDNCDCVLDKAFEIPWTNLNTRDYLIPGLGHLKKGPNNESLRKMIAYSYATSFIASTSYSVYSKLKSRKYYNDHLESETFREAKASLINANIHQRRFLISAGISTLIFSANATHLFLVNKRQETYRKESLKKQERPIDSDICYSPSFKFYQDNSSIGIGLVFNLN